MAHMTVQSHKHPERFVKLGSHETHVEYKNDVLYISLKEQLKPYPQKLTDRLLKYAETYPNRVFAAKRDSSG
ncbi:feruloyl-CoA synthase, partial [Acinetobacter bohemicus]|nr:feruloyl-CoA synthase [Acinetobacter bohemicus]